MNCPDCKKDGRLELMLYVHDETVNDKVYCVLECMSCGSSIRIPKEKKADG